MRDAGIIPNLFANFDFATFVPGVSLFRLVLVFPGFGEREVIDFITGWWRGWVRGEEAAVKGKGGKGRGRQKVYLPPFREAGKIRREKQKRETPGTKDAKTKVASKF